MKISEQYYRNWNLESIFYYYFDVRCCETEKILIKTMLTAFQKVSAFFLVQLF